MDELFGLGFSGWFWVIFFTAILSGSMPYRRRRTATREEIEKARRATMREITPKTYRDSLSRSERRFLDKANKMRDLRH